MRARSFVFLLVLAFAASCSSFAGAGTVTICKSKRQEEAVRTAIKAKKHIESKGVDVSMLGPDVAKRLNEVHAIASQMIDIGIAPSKTEIIEAVAGMSAGCVTFQSPDATPTDDFVTCVEVGKAMANTLGITLDAVRIGPCAFRFVTPTGLRYATVSEVKATAE